MSEAVYTPITTTEQNFHSAPRASFVALPSDPAVRLSREQLSSIFGGSDVAGALHDLLRLLREKRGEHVA